MATTIKLKNGSGAPLAADLVQGEVALDLTNKRIYSENASGTVIEMGTSPSTIDINAGTIDGTVIGGASAAAGTFTTLNATGGGALTGTWSNLGTVTTVDINGGTIDGVTIGGASAGAGTFTTLTGSGDMAIDTDTLFVDVSTDRVGINTSSPAGNLHAEGGEVFFKHTGNSKLQLGAGNTSSSFIEFGDTDDGDVGRLLYSHSDNSMQFTVNAAERLRIDSSGNLGLGVTPSAWTSSYKAFDIGAQGSVYYASGYFGYTNNSYWNGANIYKANGYASDYYTQNGAHVWRTAPSGTAGNAIAFTQAMTLDASGRLGIGTTSPSGLIHLSANTDETTLPSIVLQDSGTTSTRLGVLTNNSGDINLSATASLTDIRARVSVRDDRTILFSTAGSERMRLDSSGNVGIGTSSPSNLLHLKDEGYQLKLEDTSSGNTGEILVSDTSLYFFSDRSNAKTSSDIRFSVDGTERMRITSSGNVGIGTTSNPVLSTGGATTGTWITPADYIAVGSEGTCLQLNRQSTDGTIAEFRKDGTTVGAIGAFSSQAYYAGANSGIRFYAGGYIPVSNTGAAQDNTQDIGLLTVRYDDIYATNGTIQTSDRNEKQDIEAMSEAEQRVAVAAKGLLRKFRWKSKVAEKGDDARIHFGIIAQDLQAAFEAEGLDAGRYAMFIHSTWTDEETGEERSRMGVRYSELLAFIIAAI